MKKRQTLTKKLMNDISFGYVQALGEQEQRAIAFYEYARHCKPIKDWVSKLRQTRAFDGGQLDPASLRELASNSHILRLEQLLGLAKSDAFPDKPYKDSKAGRDLFRSAKNFYGTDRVACIPWTGFDALRANLKRGRTREQELDVLEKWNGIATVHAISVPWKYSNAELAKKFLELLPQMRPSRFPEPKKAGRKGRADKLGSLDMLRQLVAYRLNRANFPYLSSRSPYLSENGEKKAVKLAAQRIDMMMKRPFFG
jgi:hypothetical protein